MTLYEKLQALICKAYFKFYPNAQFITMSLHWKSVKLGYDFFNSQLYNYKGM